MELLLTTIAQPKEKMERIGYAGENCHLKGNKHDKREQGN